MATEQEIMQCLAILTASYPEWQKDLPPENLRQTFSVYVQLLTDVPGEALKEATLTHVRESKFFPKVAELREGAIKAKHTLWRQARNAMLPAPPPSTDERARVKALIAELTEKFDATKSTLH